MAHSGSLNFKVSVDAPPRISLSLSLYRSSRTHFIVFWQHRGRILLKGKTAYLVAISFGLLSVIIVRGYSMGIL